MTPQQQQIPNYFFFVKPYLGKCSLKVNLFYAGPIQVEGIVGI